MENDAGEQGLALQQLFPYKSSSLFLQIQIIITSHSLLQGLQTWPLYVFNTLFFISGILKVAAHNFMKSRSRDGLAAEDQFLCSL